MNGWLFSTVFLIAFVICSNPIRSQINCSLGVEPACAHLTESYR